jgi:hypothetical protein
MPSSVVFFSVTCPQYSVSCPPVTVLRYVEQQNGRDFVRTAAARKRFALFNQCYVLLTLFYDSFSSRDRQVKLDRWDFRNEFPFCRKGGNTSTFSCNVMCNAIILWFGIYEVQVCKTSRILRNRTYCTNVFRFRKKKTGSSVDRASREAIRERTMYVGSACWYFCVTLTLNKCIIAPYIQKT